MDRPKALNALCSDLFTEVNDALRNYDSNGNIGAVVITGSKKAFAGEFSMIYPTLFFFTQWQNNVAGADIKEMKDNTFVDTYTSNFLGHWAEMTEIKKPIIAAVNGYAVSYEEWRVFFLTIISLFIFSLVVAVN